MSAELKLRCAIMPADEVTFVHKPGAPHMLIDAMENTSEQRASVDLNERQARELFNWLGVQLHSGGWGS